MQDIKISSYCTNAPSLPKLLLPNTLLLTLTSPVHTLPGLKDSLEAITLSREVFPDPLPPIIAVTSLGLANPEIS